MMKTIECRVVRLKDFSVISYACLGSLKAHEVKEHNFSVNVPKKTVQRKENTQGLHQHAI